MTAYQDHILEARDVCGNCHQIIRVERVDPVRGGIKKELDSHYARHQEHTSVEYAPADQVSDIKGVFCECGVENHRLQHRIWSDVSQTKAATLIKHTAETLTAKSVDYHTRRFVELSLQAVKDGQDIDAAMSDALETAIQIEAAKPSPQPD